MRGLASIKKRWVVCGCVCVSVCGVRVCVNLTVWVSCVIQHQYALCEPMRGLASISNRWVACAPIRVTVWFACVV
jgi:hypothetical protein